MPFIEAHQLSKAYDIVPVLRSVDITVERGQFVALLGPNGSGKSTLLRLLAGLTQPTSGTLTVGGWHMPDESEAIRAHVGWVSHESLLYDHLTAQENLDFYATMYHVPPASRHERVTMLLADVGLTRYSRQTVNTFSRGMKQRLSIARALVSQPDLLLLDEPYTGLDPDASTTLDALLRSLALSQRTIIMSTHQLERAETLAQRALILHHGRVMADIALADATMPLAEAYQRAVSGAAVPVTSDTSPDAAGQAQHDDR